MNPLAEKLTAYYAQHPPNLDDAESILDMLWWCYTECNPIDDAHCKEKLTGIREQLSFLSSNDFEEVFGLICDLCVNQERLAFLEGVRVGVMLMQELKME